MGYALMALVMVLGLGGCAGGGQKSQFCIHSPYSLESSTWSSWCEPMPHAEARELMRAAQANFLKEMPRDEY